MNSSNSLLKGLEDCDYQLDTEKYDNLQTFRSFHKQIEIAHDDFVNSETRLAYWVYMTCENFLYRHELNEDGQSLKYPNKEDYLREVDRLTGRGVSTLKRDIGAVGVARILGYTVTDLAVRGIQPFVKIFQNFQFDTEGNPLKLKSGPIPQDKEPAAYAVEVVETLTAAGEYITDKDDMGSRKKDNGALEHRLLRPGLPRIWTEHNEHGSFWFYEKYVDAMLIFHTGEIIRERSDNEFSIKFTGQVIPEEVETYFANKKLGL